MSLSLIEALSQVDLEPGRTYRCRVKGRMIELHVQEVIPPALMPAPLNESDVMLDPWVEFPAPSGGIVLQARLGEPEPPDIPDIPPYFEGDVGGMLDPWVELPSPKPIGTVMAQFAPPSPPDIPEIPCEDDMP